MTETSEEAPATDPRRERMLRAATLFYAGLILISLGLSVLRETPLFWRTRPASILDVVRELGYGLAVGLAIIVVSNLVTRTTGWGQRFERVIREVFGPLTLGDCFHLALLSALGEELFFRGALQPLLGLYPTSLLFGLAHWPPERALVPWTVMAGLLGLGFGVMVESSGQLAGPIAAHFLVNFVNLHLLTRPRA